MIAENLESVTRRIAKCCERSGRDPGGVKLVCVTKEAGLPEIGEALALGVKDIGENRVQDAILKYRAIGNRAIWHLVGHLQTNKVRDVINIFSLIHSVDSLHLAEKISAEAAKINKIQDILIEVNISGEKTKFGIAPDEVEEFFKRISSYHNINIKGLMTIAPEVEKTEIIRSSFRALRELRDRINELRITNYELRTLSMGMSNDFEIAIEEGSNMVRIGRAIFGEE